MEASTIRDLGLDDLRTRLEALSGDLDRFPSGVRCPWQLARVYNELLKRVKRAVPSDPMLRALRAIDEAVDAGEDNVSTEAIGTVRGLISQAIIAIDGRSGTA